MFQQEVLTLENEMDKTKERKGWSMTIEKAMTLSPEEFAMLDKQYEGFNKETYTNHQTHNGEETFYDFIEKGSERIKNIQLLKNAD